EVCVAAVAQILRRGHDDRRRRLGQFLADVRGGDDMHVHQLFERELLELRFLLRGGERGEEECEDEVSHHASACARTRSRITVTSSPPFRSPRFTCALILPISRWRSPPLNSCSVTTTIGNRAVRGSLFSCVARSKPFIS